MTATSIHTQFWDAPDGTRLAWHELGVGFPIVLLHGYASDAATNWVRYGHAQQLADAGFRVIMPDLRGHGQSGKPHDPALYPPDVLADDAVGLVEALGLKAYGLGGYSLGARTVVRMLAAGEKPVCAIVCGMGLMGITETQPRTDHFRRVLDGFGTHSRGSPEWMAEAFIKATGGDQQALRLVLESFVDTNFDILETLGLPIAVVCGDADDDNGSAADLAAALPDAAYVEIPGNHMSAVTKPDLGNAIVAFLEARLLSKPK